MNENEKEPVDVSAHLSEEELPKPGATINPGQSQDQPSQSNPVKAADATPDHFHDDLNEVRTFAEQQNEEIPEGKQSSGFGHVVWEIVKTLLIAAAVVLIINTFLFQAYYVSGNSMNPDYHDGDYLLINKIPTTFRTIQNFFGAHANVDAKHGDIVVFRPPEAPQLFFIKRVIGIPGDRVVLKDGTFTIYNKENPNGLVLKEPYIGTNVKTEGDVDTVVEQGNLFVVGDNRAPGGSYDSRAWGQLPQDNLSGIAFFRLIPLSGLGFISLPDYQSP